MWSATNSTAPQSPFCETAQVRLVSRSRWPQSNYKLAYVHISCRIYWKVVNEDATNEPQSLADFQNADSVELSRRDDGTWKNVDDDVKVENDRRVITICGRPHGRTRRNNALFGGKVRLEILSATPKQHNAWVNQIRARLVPWDLLQQEVRAVASGAPSSKVEELRKALDALVLHCANAKPPSTATDTVEGKRNEFFEKTLPEQMEKLSIVEKLNTHLAGAVGTVATVMTRVECVAETAKLIADVSKGIGGVSSIFHLVALGAQGASLCAKASHGRRVLPVTLGQIGMLLEYVLQSMTEIMKPTRDVNEIDIDFVLETLKKTLSAMDMAETQLLRGRGRQIVKAEDVTEVKKILDELRHKAVTAGNTSKIYAVYEKVNHWEEQQGIFDDGPHHVPPSVSSFFSGRTKELNTLEDILEKQGSAVITQYGGVGKTELMIAFADRAVREEVVPGGVFWVTVDGGKRDVIESLAKLAEKLTRRKMGEEERRNGNLVVAVLKQGLDERDGRWLLCLDNADDSKVSGILNEVCGLAVGTQGNGWVVVSSRQGQPHIWSRMKSEQKLVLKPLSAEDAMVALWRQIRKVETSEADDNGVMNEIKELEMADADEYRALKELCGDEGASSLGGLPLALVQAGAYMARFKCSLAEYLNMFKTASKREDMEDIMRNTEELKPIRESQRSIWTTWKISVEQLTGEAYTILRAMAMLGPCGVGEAMVKGIMEGTASTEGRSVDWMFRKVVIEELVHGSSLIFRNEEGQEGKMYRMHRLVRRFVVSDMERGSDVWNDVYSLALVCLHEAVETELGKEGKSFEQLPDVFENNHHEISLHAIALVHHHTLPAEGAEIRNVSQIEDIHWYSGNAMEFQGKLEETVQVCERLVDVLEHQQVASRSKSCNQGLLDSRNDEESHIATAYDSLGMALMKNGRLHDAAFAVERSLEMWLAIHGPNKPHPAIATSFNNLGLLYQAMGKLDKALENHEKSLQMWLAIQGPNKPHPDIATSFNNLGLLYKAMGKLDKALENHEKSIQMRLAIHGPNKPHPAIATSFNNLGGVYEAMGKLDKALENHEKSLQMRLTIHGPNKPHPDIATSFNNLGLLYEGMGKLDKALENHEKSLQMRLAIHGPNKPHPAIATSFNNLGLLYQAIRNLDKALENHEKAVEMDLAIHGPNKPHPDIATSFNNLGGVYKAMGKLDKALENHEKSLQMRLAIHGPNKPHSAIAISLWHIGIVCHKQKNLDRAVEVLLESLEMLRTVHSGNPQHRDITKLLSHLADVYEDQGRHDEALAIGERNTEAEETSDGEALRRSLCTVFTYVTLLCFVIMFPDSLFPILALI